MASSRGKAGRDGLETVPVGELRPHPLNYRSHPPDQIEHLARSIRDNGVYRNVVCARDGTLLAGHGVVEACRSLGLEVIPVRRLDLEPMEPRALKVLAGDNESSRLAADDEQALARILGEVRDAGAGLLGTGHDDASLAALLGTLERTNPYSTHVDTPVYQPTGEEPPLSSLADTTRRDAILAGIEASAAPPDVRAFLRLAAERHTVFHYRNVAEFYAHADPETQRLMEDSALVIIDVERAIELGYARLRTALDGLREESIRGESHG